MVFNIFQGISYCIQVIQFVITVYCFCSWFLSPTNRLYELLRNFSWPFIEPFRPLSMRLMMRTGLRLDLSAVMAIIALNILNSLVWRLYSLVFF